MSPRRSSQFDVMFGVSDRWHLFRILTGLGFVIHEVVYCEVWDRHVYGVLQRQHPEHYRVQGQSTFREHLDDETMRLIQSVAAFFFERTPYLEA